jgi:hypothetical protein
MAATAATAQTSALPPSRHGCNYYELCLYAEPDFEVMVARMSSCVFHDVRTKFFSSYVNNQTAGTRGAFYDGDLNRITFTQPAYYEGTTRFGLTTMYVRPC